MHIVALCPTFGRPSLVRNALALFLAQQLWPGQSAHLMIYSDDGLIPTQHGGRPPLTWEVWGTDAWIPLTEKYAPMLARARELRKIDAWCVWDDDDVYLPTHIRQHAATLEHATWSHPSHAYSTYETDPLTEPPQDRILNARHYHGALAVRDDLMQTLGGWPKTNRSDYDKQMLAACHRAAPPGDPCQYGPSTYIYRWHDTGRDHCSARIQSGQYRPPRIQEPPLQLLTPQFDASTAALISRFASQI